MSNSTFTQDVVASKIGSMNRRPSIGDPGINPTSPAYEPPPADAYRYVSFEDDQAEYQPLPSSAPPPQRPSPPDADGECMMTPSRRKAPIPSSHTQPDQRSQFEGSVLPPRQQCDQNGADCPTETSPLKRQCRLRQPDTALDPILTLPSGEMARLVEESAPPPRQQFDRIPQNGATSAHKQRRESGQPDTALDPMIIMPSGKMAKATGPTAPPCNPTMYSRAAATPDPTNFTARTRQYGKSRSPTAIQPDAVAVLEEPSSEASEPGATTRTGAAPKPTSGYTVKSLMEKKQRPAASASRPGAVSVIGNRESKHTKRPGALTVAPATVPGAVAATSPSHAVNTASNSGLPVKLNRGPAAATPGAVSIVAPSSMCEPKLKFGVVTASTSASRPIEAQSDFVVVAAAAPGGMRGVTSGMIDGDVAQGNASADRNVTTSVVQMVEQDALAKHRNTNRGPAPTAPGATAPGVQSVVGRQAEHMDASVVKEAQNSVPTPSTDRDQVKVAANRQLRSNEPNWVNRNTRNQKMARKLWRMEQEREQEVHDKMNTTAADPSHPPLPSRPTIPEPTAEHPFPHLTLRAQQREEPVMEAATTTADRGVTIAPEVEYGHIVQAPEDEGLAVAMLVDEDDEDDEYYPYAVPAGEYDPDAKPPLYRNRRCQLFSLLGCTIVLGIIVLVPVALAVGRRGGTTIFITDPPSMTPTAAPTSVEQGRVAELLRSELSFEFEEIGTPQERALRWILDEDPIRQEQNQNPTQRYLLAGTSNLLLQRYLLVLFYFLTSEMGTKKWRSCNPPGPGENETCTFMEFTRLQNDSVAFEPKPATRWLSGAHECDWVGVTCFDDDAEVRVVELFGQELRGTLPTELADLPLLQSIALPFNLLTGTLSDVFAGARHLRNLEVHGNMLEGTIPDAYFGTEELANFNVGDNMLSGTISPELSRWVNLKGLHLFENLFTGTIPTEMGLLSVLSFTRVNQNSFTGTLPTQLGELALLEELWFQTNDFTSTLPSQAVQGWRRLTDLRVNANQLTGSIPDSIYDLPRLQLLYLHDNMFTGTLSTRIGRLEILEDLRLRRNQLTGTIPTEIANIQRLLLAWFHFNLFNGTVPDALCNRRGLAVDNKLEFLQSDCDPEGAAATPCSCCSACCDQATGLCTLRD